MEKNGLAGLSLISQLRVFTDRDRARLGNRGYGPMLPGPCPVKRLCYSLTEIEYWYSAASVVTAGQRQRERAEHEGEP